MAKCKYCGQNLKTIADALHYYYMNNGKDMNKSECIARTPKGGKAGPTPNEIIAEIKNGTPEGNKYANGILEFTIDLISRGVVPPIEMPEITEFKPLNWVENLDGIIESYSCITEFGAKYEILKGKDSEYYNCMVFLTKGGSRKMCGFQSLSHAKDWCWKDYKLMCHDYNNTVKSKNETTNVDVG